MMLLVIYIRTCIAGAGDYSYQWKLYIASYINRHKNMLSTVYSYTYTATETIAIHNCKWLFGYTTPTHPPAVHSISVYCNIIAIAIYLYPDRL